MIREVPAAMMADLAGQILGRGSPVRMRVLGDSMKPTLLSGDEVWLSLPDARPPRRGDLVAVRTGGSMYIHRLVRLLPDGSLLTAGDNVAWRDAASRGESLLGVVEKIERDGRTFRPGRGYRELFLAEARRGWAALGRRFAKSRPTSTRSLLR